MEHINYKIFKYKIKFLNSIVNTNFNKSGLYLKKYSTYINKNNFNSNSTQIGGSVVEIIDQKNLDDLMLNISNLINTIFGEDLGNTILNEFKTKSNFNKITFPAEINMEILIQNIFKSVYSNSETGKYSDDKFEKQINTYINEILKKNNYETKSDIKSDIKSETKSEEYNSVKYLLDLVKTKEQSEKSEKSEQSEQLSEINKFFSPYNHNQTIITPTIPIIYSQPVVNWNSDDLGINIKFSDATSYSSNSSSESDFSEKLSKKHKRQKNKFGNNVIIY